MLCDPVNCSTPGFPVLHYLLKFAQTHVRRVSDAIQSSQPLSPSPLPSILPSIFQNIFSSVFSSESALCIRWQKYWSFNFSISPSSEHMHHLSSFKTWGWDFSGSPVAKTLCYHAGVTGSIPGQGTRSHILQEKILHAITKIEVQVIPGGKVTTKSQEKVMRMKCAIYFILFFFWNVLFKIGEKGLSRDWKWIWNH